MLYLFEAFIIQRQTPAHIHTVYNLYVHIYIIYTYTHTCTHRYTHMHIHTNRHAGRYAHTHAQGLFYILFYIGNSVCCTLDHYTPKSFYQWFVKQHSYTMHCLCLAETMRSGTGCAALCSRWWCVQGRWCHSCQGLTQWHWTSSLTSGVCVTIAMRCQTSPQSWAGGHWNVGWCLGSVIV